MKIPYSSVLRVLSQEYIIHSLDDFLIANEEFFKESLNVAKSIEDYYYLSVMTGETSKYNDFVIIYKIGRSTLPIILEKNKSLTLFEIAKLYCDSNIDITVFYQAIEFEASEQTMDPTSLLFQFDLYVNMITKTRKESEKKIGRNDACPCKSGKKFKHCHGAEM